MPKIVYRSNFIPTYSHAYNEFGNFLSIENAVLLHQQQEFKWYFDFNKEIELILSAVNSNKVTSHWKAKANQFITTIDGIKRKYDPTLHGESFEHSKFKNEIVENKFFETNKYKVLLQECKTEIKFVNSRFIADVKAKLLCGTDCIIEVIKTSDLSENKTKEIQKNQLLTFKIYIDEFGNQKHSRFKIIGNTELEQITIRVQKGRGAVAEIGERIVMLEEQIQNRREKYNEGFSSRVFKFKSWLQRRLHKEIKLFEDKNNLIKNHLFYKATKKTELKLGDTIYIIDRKMKYEIIEVNNGLLTLIDENKKQFKYVLKNILNSIDMGNQILKLEL